MPILSLSLALAIGAAPPPFRFDLEGSGGAGRTRVSPGEIYRPGRWGYESSRRASEFLFSVALPEGNHRVTLRLGDADRASRTTVKAETRRLMLDEVTSEAGAFVSRSFVVNVRNGSLPALPEKAAGGTMLRLNAGEVGSYGWDEKLTLEFLGDPAVAGIDIAPADVPTIFLVGDSTVTDQRSEPAASWGQMLPVFFDDGIAIANHAESGETLKSFLTGLRLDKLLSAMKPGDWLLIQFGHNDQKSQWPQTYADPRFTYPAYLRAYIAEARRRGATPVLVTSPERRNFDSEGRIRSTLADYAAAARTVAAEENVPLIDLNRASIALYEALGPEGSEAMFNDGGADRTHHNNYGAWLLARAVTAEIALRLPALASHLRPDLDGFDATRPPLPGQVSITSSIAENAARPAGN